MTLIWIRHGETAHNAARVLQPPDTPLSGRGLAQARAVAERLAQPGSAAQAVAAVLASDLPRARQTAEAVAAACGAPLPLGALLHERNFGALRGQPYDGLGFDPLTMSDAPPQGESMAAFEARVAAAWAEAVALRRRLGGSLAVVTHGLVIRALLQGPVALAPGEPTPARIGNTAVTEIDDRPPHRVRVVNCTAHLAALDGEDAASLAGG